MLVLDLFGCETEALTTFKRRVCRTAYLLLVTLMLCKLFMVAPKTVLWCVVIVLLLAPKFAA